MKNKRLDLPGPWGISASLFVGVASTQSSDKIRILRSMQFLVVLLEVAEGGTWVLDVLVAKLGSALETHLVFGGAIKSFDRVVDIGQGLGDAGHACFVPRRVLLSRQLRYGRHRPLLFVTLTHGASRPTGRGQKSVHYHYQISTWLLVTRPACHTLLNAWVGLACRKWFPSLGPWTLLIYFFFFSIILLLSSLFFLSYFSIIRSYFIFASHWFFFAVCVFFFIFILVVSRALSVVVWSLTVPLKTLSLSRPTAWAPFHPYLILFSPLQFIFRRRRLSFILLCILTVRYLKSILVSVRYFFLKSIIIEPLLWRFCKFVIAKSIILVNR